MRLLFCNRNDPAYEDKLNALLKKVFFNFRFWYDLGLWDERYESHALESEGKIVSNVCVFKSRLFIHGKEHPALSFGAVATHPEYRGRGLSRMLMERVIGRYGEMPMYLSANEEVLDFYPRFGFRQAQEKVPAISCRIDNDVAPRRMAYDAPEVFGFFKNRRGCSRIFDCRGMETVNMFHVHSGSLKDCIYTLPELGAMVIARQNGETLRLLDVVSDKSLKFEDVKPYLPFKGIRRVEFAFMPDWLEVPYTMEPCGEKIFFFGRGFPCEFYDFKFPELALT